MWTRQGYFRTGRGGMCVWWGCFVCVGLFNTIGACSDITCPLVDLRHIRNDMAPIPNDRMLHAVGVGDMELFATHIDAYKEAHLQGEQSTHNIARWLWFCHVLSCRVRVGAF